MRDAARLLTEREKEALRLLLAGHDAKSSAQHLGLSVHTINERLRDARRKLGVSSSRGAARLLAAAERNGDDLLGDKDLGVVAGAAGLPDEPPAGTGPRVGHPLAWFGGGMVIMSLIIAAVALSSVLGGADAPQAERPPATAAPGASASAGLPSARAWVALLDRQRWAESWRTAALPFRSQITAAQWASTIRSVRQPIGPVSARSFRGVTRTTSLPGVPSGEYEVIEFATDFARKAGAIETVVLRREGDGWRVAGYFIR